MNEFPPQVGDIWQYGDLLHRFEVLSQEKVGTRFRYKVCRLKNGEICKMWMGDRPWRLIMRPGTEDTFPPQIGDVWIMAGREERPITITRKSNEPSDDCQKWYGKHHDGNGDFKLSIRETDGECFAEWKLIERKL